LVNAFDKNSKHFKFLFLILSCFLFFLLWKLDFSKRSWLINFRLFIMMNASDYCVYYWIFEFLRIWNLFRSLQGWSSWMSLFRTNFENWYIWGFQWVGIYRGFIKFRDQSSSFHLFFIGAKFWNSKLYIARWIIFDAMFCFEYKNGWFIEFWWTF